MDEYEALDLDTQLEIPFQPTIREPQHECPADVWTEASTRRLSSQMQIIRRLQYGQPVTADLMHAAGGTREVLSSRTMVPPCTSVKDRMVWLKQVATPEAWALPAAIYEDMRSGGDMSAFVEKRQEVTARRVKERTAELEQQGGGDVASAIESRALRLLDLQRKLRNRVVQYEPMSGLPAPEALRFIKRQEEPPKAAEIFVTKEGWTKEREVAKAKEKQASYLKFLDGVCEQHDNYKQFYKERKDLLKKVCKEIMKRVKDKEREKLRQSEKEKRQRLQALKSDNIAEYRKHIQDSKNERMKMVVARMDDYMLKLGANIGNVTKSHERSEEEYDAERMSQVLTEYNFSLPINEQFNEQASILGSETLRLKPYQIEGVNWLVNLYNNNLSGILADEMGLGKTIQVIGMICHLIEKKGNNGPYMIIAPLSTISNWQNEFERWAPTVSAIVYKGNPQQRKELFNTLLKESRFNVLIVQFELVMEKQDAKRLKGLQWSYIIVDEGHRLKNRESKLFACLTGKNGYQANNRVILSGTPLQNEIHELWSLLNFLLPEVFDTNEDFEEWFTKPFKTGEEVDVEVVDEEKEFLIKCLHAVLRPFMTRRLKADLGDVMQLPEARESILKCELSSLQKVLYLQTENHVLTQQLADGTLKQKKTSNRMQQLRKVCNHPFLFDEYNLGEDLLVRSCGKFELLDRILPKLKVAGHRVLIYSQMVKLLHLLQRYCEIRGYENLLLSGESASDDRISMMQRWNEQDSKYFVFMLSTRAGGQGINLQTADTVIIYDSDWNPMMDEQAKARVHRIGQTKQCLVLRLVTPNTVEEKVFQRAEERLRNEDLAIETGKFNLRTDVSDTHELLRVKLQNEFADKMDQAKQEAHTDDQINELIARTPEEIEWFNRIDEERKAEEMASEEPPPPRLMNEAEVPVWLLGEPIFLEDKVHILAEFTSSDMSSADILGTVVGMPTVSQPMFLIELVDGTSKCFPRTQIRLCKDESQDRFREDLGYGRGQRDRKEVSRGNDLSALSDRAFDRALRVGGDMLDENGNVKQKKKRRKKGGDATQGGAAVSTPVEDSGMVDTEQMPPPRFYTGEEEYDGVGGFGMGLDDLAAPSGYQYEGSGMLAHSMLNSGGGAAQQTPAMGARGYGMGTPDSRSPVQEMEGTLTSNHKEHRPRKAKKAPWLGGDAAAWIKGRKVYFTLGGTRFGVASAKTSNVNTPCTPASPYPDTPMS